jgi:hypothetical protein
MDSVKRAGNYPRKIPRKSSEVVSSVILKNIARLAVGYGRG